jgi:hypothetical protein
MLLLDMTDLFKTQICDGWTRSGEMNFSNKPLGQHTYIAV